MIMTCDAGVQDRDLSALVAGSFFFSPELEEQQLQCDSGVQVCDLRLPSEQSDLGERSQPWLSQELARALRDHILQVIIANSVSMRMETFCPSRDQWSQRLRSALTL